MRGDKRSSDVARVSTAASLGFGSFADGRAVWRLARMQTEVDSSSEASSEV